MFNISSNTSNKILMERIKCSDERAFSILYDRLWEKMYRKAYSILDNKYKAKDIVQEVWINFWERRLKIENDNIEGYLLNSVRFKVFNEFRNSKNKSSLIDDFIKSNNATAASNNIYNEINLKETQFIINNSIKSLPKKCKEVFELSRLDGLKNKEIALKLNLSQRTVETHISNALKNLRKKVALGLTIIFLIFF